MRNWDDLRIFIAVARAQRIAPAARMLGIDTTTVNRRLARLAEESASPLFETVAGDRRLTDAGQALLAHAETIEGAIIAASAGRTARGSVAGHVRVSVAEGLATCVLAPATGAFRSVCPDIRLDLITASGYLNPSKREADIAVMLARPRNTQLRATPLARYRLRLYASRDYADRNGLPASRGALGGHALVSYVSEHVYAPELDYLSEIESGLQPQFRSTSINVQHGIVLTGAGIGILPDFMAAGDPELRVVLEDEVALHRTFWLVTHQDTYQAPRIQAVTDWLQRVVPERLVPA